MFETLFIGDYRIRRIGRGRCISWRIALPNGDGSYHLVDSKLTKVAAIAAARALAGTPQ